MASNDTKLLVKSAIKTDVSLQGITSVDGSVREQ